MPDFVYQHPRMFHFVVIAVAIAIVPIAAAAPRLSARAGEVVAFVGGSDVAAAQYTGHIEALLAVAFPGVKFRNFGWEGDTVFAQPRDFGFPPLTNHLARANAAVIVVEFGRAEALNDSRDLKSFADAYARMVDRFSALTPRILLVTAAPFEDPGGLLPNLAKRNSRLGEHVATIKALAKERNLPVVDLFTEFGGPTHRGPTLTDNGFQLTPRGHAFVAAAFARQLGFTDLARRAENVDDHGAWSDPQLEKIRQTTVAKNRLWFNYWRPQNWAFLGGDRISQPSSHDHRDPKVRWFPAEMEKWVPLMEEKERAIEDLAAVIRGRQ